MSEAPTSDEVTVRIAWTETCKYETKVKMSRADYERLDKLLDGTMKEVNRAEAEIFHAHDLNRVEPHDWDDLEVDTFAEVTNG
jgi:hypothetical protein